MNTAVIETHQQSHESGVSLEPSNGFAVTPHIEEIVESALAYLQAGYPVHFSGACWNWKNDIGLPRCFQAWETCNADSWR